MNIGFLGSGYITSSIIEGIFKSKLKIKKIYISPRNRTIANNPILYCIPKDAEQTSMEIQLNPNCTWENVGRPGEARVTELQKTILDFLKDDKERSSMEIVGHVTNKLPEVKDGHVRKEISRLVDKSHITKLKRRLYRKVPF